MTVTSFLAAWADRAAATRTELDALDAAAGDGDHGSTVARGASAAATADGPSDRALLIAAGRAFTDAAGGASGPLLGSILDQLGRACEPDLDDDAFAAGLDAAVGRVEALGRVAIGDGTLLDALAAAAADPDRASARALAASRATAQVEKRRGRAALVEGAGLGHEDPGARSVALLLSTLEAHR